MLYEKGHGVLTGHVCKMQYCCKKLTLRNKKYIGFGYGNEKIHNFWKWHILKSINVAKKV